jgi:hypothetical protein
MSNPFTIGRHGSFQLRYGWITKGIQAIQAKKNWWAMLRSLDSDQ